MRPATSILAISSKLRTTHFRSTLLRTLVFFVSFGLLTPMSGLADILVMVDGSRLEVDGEWREKGRVIEFTLPNGTLGSVRATEVDLKASQRATEAAEKKAAEAGKEETPKEKPEPIAVWTDKDIPQAAPDVIAGASASVAADAVRVVDWRVTGGADRGLLALISGTIQNYGGNEVRNLSLSVTVIGDRANGSDPTLVRQARLEQTALGAGETTTFEVEIHRRDVISVGTEDEFANPQATFEVVFTGNPRDLEDEEEGDSDSSEDDSSDDDSQL